MKVKLVIVFVSSITSQTRIGTVKETRDDKGCCVVICDQSEEPILAIGILPDEYNFWEVTITPIGASYSSFRELAGDIE